jgi:hypothetical protein
MTPNRHNAIHLKVNTLSSIEVEPRRDFWKRNKSTFTCRPYPNRRVDYSFELPHTPKTAIPEALGMLAHISRKRWSTEPGIARTSEVVS